MNVGGVLITNNTDGNHPPESWAAVTASMIFAVDNNIAGVDRIKAMQFQARLAEMLVEHHRHVQEEEQRALQSNDDHHASALGVDDGHLDEVVNAVMQAGRESQWKDQFNQPHMENNIRQLIADHFVTSKQIERQAHRKRKGMPEHLPHPGEEWERNARDARRAAIEEGDRMVAEARRGDEHKE